MYRLTAARILECGEVSTSIHQNVGSKDFVLSQNIFASFLTCVLFCARKKAYAAVGTRSASNRWWCCLYALSSISAAIVRIVARCRRLPTASHLILSGAVRRVTSTTRALL